MQAREHVHEKCLWVKHPIKRQMPECLYQAVTELFKIDLDGLWFRHLIQCRFSCFTDVVPWWLNANQSEVRNYFTHHFLKTHSLSRFQSDLCLSARLHTALWLLLRWFHTLFVWLWVIRDFNVHCKWCMRVHISSLPRKSFLSVLLTFSASLSSLTPLSPILLPDGNE